MKEFKQNIISTAVIVTVTLPFAVLMVWSFSNRWFYPELWPRQWGLRAWDYVFGTAGFQIITALVQSMLIALATALISVAIGIPAGFGDQRLVLGLKLQPAWGRRRAPCG